MTELREVGDIESAEAEAYAARTSADQRVATAEAHLAEEIQRRRDAEAERDAAHADREQADDAATQAVARMEELERELAELRTATEREVRGIRDGAAAEIRQAREGADRDISAARAAAARPVAEAKARADHQHALDQLTVATSARVAALEETRDALRVRAERAETDLDTARTENQRLAEQLAQAVNESADDPEADNAPTPRTRAATRVKRASATRKPRLES